MFLTQGMERIRLPYYMHTLRKFSIMFPFTLSIPVRATVRLIFPRLLSMLFMGLYFIHVYDTSYIIYEIQFHHKNK